MSEPRIILFDIETNPNILTAHTLWNEGMLPFKGILEERSMICASWKVLGEKRVYSVSVLDGGCTKKAKDRGVVKKLHEVLSTADAVVAHNGDQFDVKWVNTRAILHGFGPLPPFIQIDTKKLAKHKFRFNSNRLDYLGHYLGVGRKIKTDYDLWMKCLKRDPAAIKKMVRYNKQDVLLLERVYLKLRPFVPAGINRALWDLKLDRTCPTCGANALRSAGYRVTRTAKYERLRCNECGSWAQKPTSRGIAR